jgi:predicted secreted protein with PEFG-CTERM motif
MAVLSVGSMGIASQAFADHHMVSQDIPIDISTDSDTYDHDSTISITGQVSTVRAGAAIAIVVSGPMGIVSVDQITPSADGSFSSSVGTGSNLMKYDGEYKIKATYGDKSINDTVLVTLEGGIAAGSMSGGDDHHEEGHHEAAEEAYDLTDDVSTSISGGHVESVTAGNNSVVIAIHDAEDGGELTLTVASDVLTPFDDGSYFVLVDGEESDDASQDGNTVTIPLEYGVESIEVIGTHVVPEFGTIAAIVLAVAIIAIIAVTSKSRLSLMPKL